MAEIYVMPAGLPADDFAAAIQILRQAIDGGQDLGDRRAHICALSRKMELTMKQIDDEIIRIRELPNQDAELERFLNALDMTYNSLMRAARHLINQCNDLCHDL